MEARPEPTICAAERAIDQLQPDGTTVRYTLARTRDGDVHWRGDTFVAAGAADGRLRWLSHHGRLTVVQVVAAVPSCAETVRAWTAAELEPDPSEGDWIVCGRHAHALEVLRAELAALDALDETG